MMVYLVVHHRYLYTVGTVYELVVRNARSEGIAGTFVRNARSEGIAGIFLFAMFALLQC